MIPAILSLPDAAKVLGSRARPDVPWLSRVTGASGSEVEAALASLGREASLVAELAGTISKTGRAYYAQFPAPLDLYALVKLARPGTAVESGVAAGVSSAFILLGLRSNGEGTLHSLDFPVQRRAGRGNESWAIPVGLSSGWGVPRSLRRGWDLRLGRSEELLERLLDEVGTVGFYCHDSPVDGKHFEFEMEAVRRHLRPGSVVVSDNIEWRVFERTARSVGAVAVRRKGAQLAAFQVPR